MLWFYLPSVPLFELWPPLFFPALDGLLVPLIRSALWLLQGVPERFEQTAHMSRMVADPELFANHYSYPLAGPYLSSKAVSFGSPFPCSRPGPRLFAAGTILVV